MVMAGFLLGSNVWVKENLEYIVIGLILITTAPVLFKLFSKKKSPTLEIGKEVTKDKLTPDPE